jgi:para-aminobenzoate synthetase component 1
MARQEATEPISWGSRTLAPPGNRAALRLAVAQQAGGAILESIACGGPTGRFSYYAIDPVRTLTVSSRGDPSPFDSLARFWRPARRLTPTPDVPLIAGWIGYLGYEAGRFVEPSAGWDDRVGPLPMSQGSLYDALLVHDAFGDRWSAVGVDLPPDLLDAERPPLTDRLDRLEALVQSAGGSVLAGGDAPCPGGESAGCWNYSRDAYLDKVRKVLAYIEAGDVFQVNIARRLRVAVGTDAPTLYQRLCESNPASFAAFLALGGHGGRPAQAVMSSSPELFLRLVGRAVTTRPIKGTRPRGTTRQEDAAAARALASSGKDRAELNMIVDLVRNDLGRVCEFGSVRVVCPGEIETLPTVLHRTATVVGMLREGLDVLDLLRATFPGGSVTGAPKVRAMQIIHELEPAARGPYCGAVGWVGLNGDAQFNLPIRTMTMADGVVDLSVGSGIVADSDPQEEYEELAAKAAGMMAALGVPSERTAAVAAVV